ncbi:MAG: adenylate kinase [Candidatus Woesearchaeota archaeon]
MNKIIIVMGPPGCGKGTQAKKLSEHFSLPHISTGDLFRDALAHETPIGLKAKSYMEKGEFVPDEVTEALLQSRLEDGDCAKGFILDGFPRTVPEAEFLEGFLDAQNLGIAAVLDYELPDAVVIERIQGRAQHDKEAGKHVREDDLKDDVIKKRIAVYHEETEPVISFYKAKDLVFPIDATHDVETIFQESLKDIN